MGVSSVGRNTLLSSRANTPNDTQSKSKAQITHGRDTAEFSEYAEKLSDTAQIADKNTEKDSGKTISELIKEQTEKIDKMFGAQNEENKSRQLSSIKYKMRSGLTLLPSEEQYLSRYDPDAYQNYCTIKDARRTFRMQLMCCRTKDEVNSMRLSNALSAYSAFKKASRAGGDASAVVGLNMAIEKEISSFAGTGRYKDLPTAAERDQYYAKLAKARKFEREKRLAEKLNKVRKKKKQVKRAGDGKQTVAQVENSPLGRKVRKANRAGGIAISCSGSFARSYGHMDQKG